MKQLLEREIEEKIDQILRGNVSPSDSINTFVTKRHSGGWIVEFNLRNFTGYSIKVKNTGEQRVFKTLDAVANWMQRMQIDEFQVYL